MYLFNIETNLNNLTKGLMVFKPSAHKMYFNPSGVS